jgi:signal transduction histidine kinase
MAVSDVITRRLEEKKTDYTKYSFTRVESNALKTYFDLAQEFENIEDVYQVSVAIPKAFFGLNARLYVAAPDETSPILVAGTDQGAEMLGTPLPEGVRPASKAYTKDRSMILTIRGNEQLIDQVPFRSKDNVLGVLQVYPYETEDQHRTLFFEKYANRIGFSLHLRFLLQKNMEHVRFIQGLVADIEHNVIVPNMVYKLFLRRLGGKIKKNKEIEQGLAQLLSSMELEGHEEARALLEELSEVNHGLFEEFNNIERHYRSSSLFLETLLRKSHFDEGRLTLRTTRCNMREAVVAPQLERFEGRFADKGIEIIDEYSAQPEPEAIAVVDVGLMAQVYGNLFSNAMKYTQEVVTEPAGTKKFISYGKTRMKNFFGPAKDGIKYNVFSTGPHIPQDEREKIFGEGYRGSNATKAPGTGHGLAFVKNAVRIHGGVAGYEALPLGNNFYFVLPE